MKDIIAELLSMNKILKVVHNEKDDSYEYVLSADAIAQDYYSHYIDDFMKSKAADKESLD